MVMKGAIIANHIPKNMFSLEITDLPPLTIITHASLERELEAVDLPDRTRASGGHVKAFEFEATLPEHHEVERAAIEDWFELSRRAAEGYKKNGILVKQHVDRTVGHTLLLNGLFPTKIAYDEGDMANEGEMANFTITFSVDMCLPRGGA